MTPRSSTFAASALLLVLGCSAPETPTGAAAHRPAPSASPTVAAAGPRVLSNEVVFVPALPAALRAPAGVAQEEDLLPPIPAPEGWVPAPEEASLEVPGPGVPGQGDEPVFVEEAVFEDAGLDGGTWEEAPEEIVVEEIGYVEIVELGSGEIATPVLVVEGYSSWGHGPYPVVRSSRRFDPCFTPPRGACWDADFDPCWNAGTDPDWGTWNMVCEERERRTGGGSPGIRVVDDRESPEPPKSPRPRREPVVREVPPVAPGPTPPAAPRVRSTRPVRPEPAAVEIPVASAPRREPVARASREVQRERARAGDDAVPPPRTTGGGRKSAPAAEPAPPTRTAREPRAERHPVPREEPARDHGRGRGGGGRDRAPEVQAPPTPAPPPPPPPPAPPARGSGGGGKRGR